MLLFKILFLIVFLLWLLNEMNFFACLFSFIGFLFGHSQSAYYFFLEKQIIQRLGKGFLYKELEFKENQFEAVVQYKGIRYRVLTKGRTLLQFERELS